MLYFESGLIVNLYQESLQVNLDLFSQSSSNLSGQLFLRNRKEEVGGYLPFQRLEMVDRLGYEDEEVVGYDTDAMDKRRND